MSNTTRETLPPLSRRALLAIGAAGLTTAAALRWSPPAASTSEGTVLPLVAALPGGAPDRS